MTIRAWILSVLLALTLIAPASAAFLGGNSPLGEKLLDARCLHVEGGLSSEGLTGCGGACLRSVAECFEAPSASPRQFWKSSTEFQGSKVYQRSDLFSSDTVSSWKVKGKTVTGTNIERMASGRAPIGYDGKSVNLHHLTQTNSGAVAEVSQTMHQSNCNTLHINTGELPSGINRSAFDTWRSNYWQNRTSNFR